jgi:hypothetical protein
VYKDTILPCRLAEDTSVIMWTGLPLAALQCGKLAIDADRNERVHSSAFHPIQTTAVCL